MNTQVIVRKISPAIIKAVPIILGSLVLAGLSQIEVRIGIVPVSMQTLGVFLLALFLGKGKATLSVCLYFAEGTCGLPVLSGGCINPLWMIGPTGGYLMAFPFTAFLIGKLMEKRSSASFLWTVVSIAMGQAIIYILGVGWLSYHVGFTKALTLGLLPFLWIALLKNLCAASFKRCFFNSVESDRNS